MTAVLVIFLLAFVVWTVKRIVRSRRQRSHVRTRSGRIVHCRKRQTAALQARELARRIIEDDADPSVHVAAGVILQPGEGAWGRARARLAVRTTQEAWSADTCVSLLGRRARSVSTRATGGRWADDGTIDWLITSQRIVGRLPATSQMISVWWSGLAGVDIDLKHGRIVLNGSNGWTGMLIGPTIAPIAVTAIAMCHGLEALLVHPGLKMLGQDALQQRPLPRQPEALGEGATIISLSTRRPTA